MSHYLNLDTERTLAYRAAQHNLPKVPQLYSLPCIELLTVPLPLK